jgi:hypothetical protein
LLSSLSILGIFLIIELTISLVILGTGIEILPSIISLWYCWSHRILLIEWWQREAITLWWLVIYLRLASKFTSGHILSIVDVSNIVLHQNKMCILVWTLLRLSLFNSVVQELHSLFIFFLQLSLDALVLNVLKTVHLEVVFLCLLLLSFVWITDRRLILHAWHISCCVLNLLIFLSFLSHLGKFDITFIENNFLNIVSWHLSHEKTLGISIFISLNNLIFKTDKLQNLWEHTGFHTSFLLQTLWHDRWHLRCEDFNGFGSISKLIKLSKDLTCFSLKFGLKYF